MIDTSGFEGPRGGIFGMGNVLAFQNDPLNFLSKLAHDYGDIIHFPFGPFQAYLLKHPEYVHEAIVTQVSKLHKFERVIHPFEKFVGRGTFLLEGDEWKRQHKLVQPAFHTKRIMSYIDTILNHTERMIADWEEGQVYDMAHEMHKVTMATIGEILFNVEDIEKEAGNLADAIAILSDMTVRESSALMPVPDWVPTPRNLKENHAMETLDKFMMDIIKERQQANVDKGDVLSALIDTVDTEGEKLTDKQIRDELLTLFVAGHETTAGLLAWCFYLLTEHQEIQDKLATEAITTLNGEMPTLETLGTLKYTEQVLLETLRLYPPVWMLPTRSPIEDITIGGHVIPKGSMVFISPWVIHHDPRFFDDPQTFDPDRFSEGYKKRIPSFAFFPFSGGSRVCIGQHLAMMEAQIILSTVIQNFKLELEPDQEIIPQPLVTVALKNGLKIRVHKRS